MVPLAGGTALLLALSAIQNIFNGGFLASAMLQNLAGVAACALIIALARWSSRPGWSAVVFGYAVLGWGDAQIATYLLEVSIGHASHAAQHFVVFFLTRYLAAVSIVWRPRDLAIALALNHVVALWPLVPIEGLTNALFFPAIWTSTAWIAAYLIYRAERDTFTAKMGLQEQRDRLASANAHLAQLNQEKNDLMAIAAHDLRSPLMGINVLLRIAIDDASRAWQAGADTLRTIERSCRDMAELVSRVLDAHQSEERLGDLALERRDIRPIVEAAVGSHRARAAEKAIAIDVDLPADPCVARPDPHALTRVLDNLLSNAIKFSPRGGQVRVGVAVNGAGLEVRVSDSGPGVPEAERAKLFRKFSRLSARPTDGESSSGLGLYIAKQLAEAMRGTLAVSNAPGAGATFVVTLPAASG